MNEYYNIQVDCAIILLLTLLLAHGCLKLNKKNRTNRLYFKIISMFIFIITLDIHFSACDNLNINTILSYIRNMLLIVLALCWFKFIFSFLAREYNMRVKKFIHLTIKDSIIKMNKNHLIRFLLLSITMIFSTLFKIFYQNNILSFNIICISLTICYLMLLDYEMNHDTITKVQNRFAFEKFILKISSMRNKRESSDKITVINIDLDDFKSINDNYGHKEGDKALCMFCKLLLRIFPSNCIFRYGGDEFIIILNSTNYIVPQKLVNRFTNYVNDYNLTRMKPYTLKFSYGISTCSVTNINIHNVLLECDNLMYAQKKCKKTAVK